VLFLQVILHYKIEKGEADFMLLFSSNHTCIMHCLRLPSFTVSRK
jgi:hypothetical protein